MTDPIPFEKFMPAAEAELDRLAARLDVPIEGKTGSCVVVLAIARQAYEVYRGLRREASAEPPGITAPILLRSLVDAAILLRWIRDAPELRIAVYMAEEDRHRLAAAAPFRAFRARRGTGSGSGPVYEAADVTRMRTRIRKARDRARAAGEPIGTSGSIMPSTEHMASVTGDTAMWEAYQVIYRITSPSTHTGAWSLNHHRFEDRPDGRHIVVEGALWEAAVRALAAPTAAHMIGSASRLCELGIEGEARIWQDAVIAWPAPIVDAMRP